jgi:mRNA-degrading endonuclease RelE of RelBE toxin-antitoxin system
MTAPSFTPAFGRVSEFQIAESKTFFQSKQQIDFVLYDRIKRIVYPQLETNPFSGPDIKKLQGRLTRYHWFRIGDYRLFYLIDKKKAVVVIDSLAVVESLQLVRRAA